MESVNFWETKLFDENWEYTDNIEVLLEKIADFGKVLVCNEFNPETDNSYGMHFWIAEVFAQKANKILVYTDETHPILLDNKKGNIVINKEYFSANKDRILDSYYDKILKVNNTFITIGDGLFDDKRFYSLLKHKADIKSIKIKDKEVSLSLENTRYMRENFIECYVGDKQISSMYLFDFYTLKQVKNSDSITIKNISDDEFENLRFIMPGTTITIADKNDIKENLDLYLKIIGALEAQNVQGKVVIDENYISNSLLKETGLPYQKFNSVMVEIDRDLHRYSLDEYLDEDKKLDSLILDIKESDLSPLEKYIAVYNIVKQFKPYKESREGYEKSLIESGMAPEEAKAFAYDPKNSQLYVKWQRENRFDGGKKQSRYLRYILNNDYMVCVGFAKLLEDLLERVGISNSRFSINVDVSYDDGFSLEEKGVEYEGHVRVLVYINDTKYDVNGYYVADPTWDNDMEKDLYSHALMTFEETTRERRMQRLGELDYIFDVHNMDEFNLKINSLIDRKISKEEERDRKFKQKRESNATLDRIDSKINNLLDNPSKTSYEKDVEKKAKREREVLRDIFWKVINVLRKINYEIYMEFYKKYAYLDSFGENLQKISKQDYYDFLSDLGNYVISRTNKPISGSKLLLAVARVKLRNQDYTEEELQQFIFSLEEEQLSSYQSAFPKMEVHNSNGNVTYINEENKFEPKRR